MCECYLDVSARAASTFKIYAYDYHICRAWYNVSYFMMTEPIKTLELHVVL